MSYILLTERRVSNEYRHETMQLRGRAGFHVLQADYRLLQESGARMKILYIAKHNSGGNDDEGAIAYALRKLGHEVYCWQESEAQRVVPMHSDFVLFHHWNNVDAIKRLRFPKVFWCFDLIHWPGDPSMAKRNNDRVLWAGTMTGQVVIGFMTDGDWVAEDRTGKLYWLPQGADERPELTYNAITMRPGPDDPKDPSAKFLTATEVTTDILFVGGVDYGRAGFITEMQTKYGEGFRYIKSGCYGPALEYEIRRAKIVVAPDTPVTDRYWSNRIYNVLKHGGFLLHPYSKGLVEQFGDSVEWYESRAQLHRLIGWALGLSDDPRRRHVQRTQEILNAKHLYRHRCEQLCGIVKEKLCLI